MLKELEAQPVQYSDLEQLGNNINKIGRDHDLNINVIKTKIKVVSCQKHNQISFDNHNIEKTLEK